MPVSIIGARLQRDVPKSLGFAYGIGFCCTNSVRYSLFESSGVATVHEQLVPYEVQDQELAFVQSFIDAPLVRAQWTTR